MMNQDFFTIIGSLFTILSFIIIIFSVTILIILVYYWQSECRSTANLIVCNSCVTLLFYGITICIQIPFVFKNNPVYSNETNTIYCKIRSFVTTYAILTKTYSYLVMAISCFFITVLYKKRILLSFRVNWMLIIMNWTVTGIMTVGTFLTPLAYAYEPESGFCILTTKHFVTSFTLITLVFLTTVGTMVILYGIIICHITRKNQINPNSQSILRAKRNMKVFRKVFIFTGTLFIGGTPFFLCIILHQIGQAPWQLYAIAHLFVAFSAALDSIILLFTNRQVKTILFAKLYCRQVNSTNETMNMNRNRGKQIVPYHNKIETIID
jgi:hypothetical protein